MPIKKFQSGVAAIEVALVMPFIVLIMVVGIDLATTIYQYNILVKNLRDGTRFISNSVRPINYNDASSTDPEVIKYGTSVTQARNLVLCGETECEKSSVSKLALSDVKLDYPAEDAGVTFVRIRIEDFQLSFLINYDFTQWGGQNPEAPQVDLEYTMYQKQQS